MSKTREIETLNIHEVAEILGVHHETVRRALANGTIPGRKALGDSGPWIVTRKNLDKYLDDLYNPRTGR